jgi:hypothetical protein
MHAAGSLLAGGGIQVVNLKVLERNVRAITGGPGARAQGAAGLAFVLARFMLLIGLVLWVFAQGWVQPLAFGMGLLLVVPASVWHGLAAPRKGF